MVMTPACIYSFDKYLRSVAACRGMSSAPGIRSEAQQPSRCSRRDAPVIHDKQANGRAGALQTKTGSHDRWKAVERGQGVSQKKVIQEACPGRGCGAGLGRPGAPSSPAGGPAGAKAPGDAGGRERAVVEDSTNGAGA